eukprot:931309-Lingulodinium_polyedra.AAC.1
MQTWRARRESVCANKNAVVLAGTWQYTEPVCTCIGADGQTATRSRDIASRRRLWNQQLFPCAYGERVVRNIYIDHISTDLTVFF